MAKEPKLLAEIRENRARAEKDAKAAKARGDAAPPTGPQFVATVVTPETPQPPNNYLAKTLDECSTVEHCEELLTHAKQHGYSEPTFDAKGTLTGGLTIKLIRDRLAELGGGPKAKSTAKQANKRGGAR